jgi:large subunit ribosomal protein L9
MAANVQVILRQDVEKLGSAGELVKVKPGFARNFLLPRSLAVVATRGNINQIEHERRAAVALAKKQREVAEGLAAQINGQVVKIAMQAADDGDKLYGSVTSRDVADALASQGVNVDRKRLDLPADGIRTLGEHEVTTKLGADVTAKFKVIVVRS